MFGTIRKHSQALWIPIIIVIIVSFVIFFTPDVSIEDFFDGGQGQSSETQEDFNEARTMLLINVSMQNSYRNGMLIQQVQQFPQKMRAQFLRGRLLPEEAGAIASSLGQIDLAQDANASIQATVQDLDDYSRLDFFTHLRLERLKKAEEMGIHVGMDTALKSIANDPRFKREGKFDEKEYTKFIDSFSQVTRIIPKGDAGKAIYREFTRQEMVLQRMGELLTASGQFIPDHAVEANWAALNRRYTAQAVFFKNDKHEANATQASTNNVDLVKQHYQKITDRYVAPPKYKVAYVEVDPAPYVAAAKVSLDIDRLTKEAIEKHLNSTNTVDHYLDENGTKLPAGTDLNATAAADILRQNQGNIGRATAFGVIKEAKGFFTSLIKGQDNDTLTAARLKEMASTVNPDGNRTLPYVEAEFEKKFGRQLEIGGVALQGATEALAGTADGKMVLRQFATQDGNATTRVYFLARLGEVGQVIRKWEDLKLAEQQEVRDAFVTAQVAEGVKQDVAELRATISELMEENDITFAEALELDENATAPHIALPPIKLNSLDAETVVPQLDQYATLSEIQNAIDMGGEIEVGWISEYTAADHNRSDGFIVHVSEIAEGERPTKAQLQEEANDARQDQRDNVNPLLREVTTLRHQLYLQQLYDKKARIKKDIEFAEREVESFKAASAAGQDVSEELMEAQESVGRLKQQQSTHLDSEIARIENLGIDVATATGGNNWRNYAIAALVILLILSFVGGDKDKKKIKAAAATKSSEPIDVESADGSDSDGEEKKSDS